MLATIDTQTYTDAARVLTHANEVAGSIAETLFAALADAAQSTGTTTGAASWASSYTAAASTVVEELSTLIEAIGNTALLLDASSHNHARAEAAAAPYGLPTYALPQRALCTVRLNGPPPVYGGNADEPFGWDMIISHLAGHTWPGADLDRLNRLATGWRTTATALRALTELPIRAGALLSSMSSPELPAAVSACHRLAGTAQTLADDCDALGAAVTQFADTVRDQRDPVREIFVDLALTVGLCELGGGALSALAGPLGELAANAYAGTRIARAAGRIVGLLAGLDETLPHLKPLLSTSSTTDTTWLKALAEARPAQADIKHTNHLLHTELDPAAGVPAAGTEAALTDEQIIETGWGSRRKLADHFGRHGADVGASTEAEYVKAAQELLRKARSEGLPTKVDSRGDTLVFDPESELFGVYRQDGKARTIYRPDDGRSPREYWDDQRGVLQ